MSLIVQKFGGTSVKDAQRIRNVAGIIAETYLQGNDVIVVLSAQGDTTGFEDPMELHTRYYFRIEGSLTDAALAFGQVEVLSEDGETAFLTDRISGQDARQQSKCLNVLACMRVLA